MAGWQCAGNTPPVRLLTYGILLMLVGALEGVHSASSEHLQRIQRSASASIENTAAQSALHSDDASALGGAQHALPMEDVEGRLLLRQSRGVQSAEESEVASDLLTAADRVERAVSSATDKDRPSNSAESQRRTGRDATVEADDTSSAARSSPVLWQPPSGVLTAGSAPPGYGRRTPRAGKPDVSNVLNSIISLLGDNVRLVGPPADRAPNRGPNRPRPSPAIDNRPLSTRINNRGPPQFVSIKNRPPVRPYPSQLPPPLRRRPGQKRPQKPSRPQRPPIAPYASGIPLPEQLVPVLGSPPTPSTPKPPILQTVMTKVTPVADITNRLPSTNISAEGSAGEETSQEETTTTTTTEAPATEPPPTTTTPPATTTTAQPTTTTETPTTEPPTTLPLSTTTTTTPAPPPSTSSTTTEPLTTTATTSTPKRPASSTTAEPSPPDTAAAAVPAQAEGPTSTPPPAPQPQWVEIPSTPDTTAAVSPSERPAPRPPPSRQPTPPLLTPPLPPVAFPGGRPGTVLDASRPGPPPIIQARPDRPRPGPALGEVFDITVSAAQGFGSYRPRPRPQLQTTAGQSHIIPVDISQLRGPGGGAGGGGVGDIITQPDAVNTVVSIDGRRTYFDLSPTDTAKTAGTYQTVDSVAALAGRPASSFPAQPARPAQPQQAQWPQKAPVVQPQWPQQQPAVQQQQQRQPPRQPPRQPTRQPPRQPQPPVPAYSSQRRPPSPPSIQIDTCIVGDDSTCKRDHNERCRTEDGVSSCLCRPGFSRLRPRTACKRVVSVVMSVKVDAVGEHRLNWDSSLANRDSEVFRQLAWDAQHAIGTAMAGTTMRDIYMGNRVSSFYSSGGGVVVNTTVRLLDTAQTRRRQVKDELRRQMSRVIQAADNRIGDSLLFVQGPLSPIPGVQDLDECSDPSQHDCDENASCSNVFGSFLCQCRPGYDDRYRTDAQRAGRYCDSCTDDYCSDRGVCSINDGQKTCECRGSYYGARCDIDGEVLGAALGATIAAAVIILATFICLCKWSKRWHKNQSHNKVEMGAIGPGSCYSFLKPSAAAAAHANFAMTMEERMRWAQIAEAMGQHNVYAVPVSLHASHPALSGCVAARSSLGRHPAAIHLSMSRAGAGAMHSSLDYVVTPVAAVSRSRHASGGGGGGGGGTFFRTLSLPPQQRLSTSCAAGPWWLPAKLRHHRKSLTSSTRRKAEPLYTGAREPGYGGVPLYASQPNLQGGTDGPASLNLPRGRPLPAGALRSMTPVYAGGERVGRGAMPLPLPPGAEEDRSGPCPSRPRSRSSMQRDFSTLSARGFPLRRQPGASGSQQQLVYGPGSAGSQQPLVYGPGSAGSASTSTQQLYDARHWRSGSRDSIYETLSPPGAGRPANDSQFEKSNSWRVAF